MPTFRNSANTTAKASLESFKIENIVTVADSKKTLSDKVLLSAQESLTQSCWPGSTRWSLPLAMLFNHTVNTIATIIDDMDVTLASAASVVNTVDMETTPKLLPSTHAHTNSKKCVVVL